MRLKFSSPSQKLAFVNSLQITIRTLLCGLLIAGQLPGLLHVSDCVETSVASQSSKGSCGCCVKSKAIESADVNLAVVTSSEPRSSHDCSQCLICRSLVTNNAEQASLYHFVKYQALQDLSCESLESAYVSTRISFARPRAPPRV